MRTSARPTTAWVKLLLRAHRAINDIELRTKRGRTGTIWNLQQMLSVLPSTSQTNNEMKVDPDGPIDEWW